MVVGCQASDPLETAREDLAQGRLDAAIERLADLAKERSDDPEILLLYGRALALSGQPGLAEWPLRKAMRHPEWTVPAGLEIASIAYRTLNYSSAIDVLDEILMKAPDSVPALLLRANARAHSKFLAEEALDDVDRVRELDPGNVDALRPEIVAYLVLDEPDAANDALEELGAEIEAGAGDDVMRAWFCTTMALFAYESRELELAETRWNDCLGEFPSDASIVAQAMEFFDERGDRARSLDIIENAVRESDLFAHSLRVTLASRLHGVGRAEEAEATLRSGTESDTPALAAAYWWSLAQFFEQTGRIRDALDAAEHVLTFAMDAESPDPTQLFSTADFAIRAGELDRALEIADVVGSEPYALLIRARVAQKRKDFGGALDYYDEAAVLWPDNSFARYHAARAAEAIGEFDRAVELYRHATRIDPEATDSQTRIARLQRAEGHLALAAQTLQMQKGRHPLEPDGELFFLELTATIAPPDYVLRAFDDFTKRHPDLAGRAIVSISGGFRASDRASVAHELLRGLGDESLLAAASAEILEELVLAARGPDELEFAGDLVMEALERHPGSGRHRLAQARLLERRGDAPTKVRESLVAAGRLSAEDVEPHARLALFDAPRDPAAAASALKNAVRLLSDAATHREIAAVRDAALALTASETDPLVEEAANEALETVLEIVPSDGRAAEWLCHQLISSGGEISDRALDLARRAARFHPTEETARLLREVTRSTDGPAR